MEANVKYINKLFSIRDCEDKIHIGITLLGFKLYFRKKKIQMFYENIIKINGKKINRLNAYPNIEISIKGVNNMIEIEDSSIFEKAKLKIYSRVNNFKIHIGKSNIITECGAMTIIAYSPCGSTSLDSFIEIGDNNIFNGGIIIIAPCTKNTGICIGNYNLFAGNIELHGVCDHLIYDLNTKKRFTYENGIKIGNKNWVASSVKFLNNATIPNNCVVGTNSLINKPFNEPNCLLAGSPAKIKRRNINWHMFLDDSYLYTDNPLQQLTTPQDDLFKNEA